VLTIAHVDVNMNLSRKRQMSNNLKKIQIIKMIALKQKVKCHFMKCGDNISEVENTRMILCFHFLQTNFNRFLSLKWMLKKVLWKNCKDSIEKSYWSWKRSKRDWKSNRNLQTFCLYNLGLQKEVHLFFLQFIILLLKNPLQYPSMRELLK